MNDWLTKELIEIENLDSNKYSMEIKGALSLIAIIENIRRTENCDYEKLKEEMLKIIKIEP